MKLYVNVTDRFSNPVATSYIKSATVNKTSDSSLITGAYDAVKSIVIFTLSDSIKELVDVYVNGQKVLSALPVVGTSHPHTAADVSDFASSVDGVVTAQLVLDKIKTVDGANSGLDADLLDGQHAAAFAPVGHTHSYQAADADLLAIAGLTGTAGFLKKVAADTWVLDTSTYALSNHNHTLVYQEKNIGLDTLAGFYTLQPAGGVVKFSSIQGDYFLGTIASSDIDDNAVVTAKIGNAQVSEAKVASNAITNAKLADMAVSTIKGRATTGTGDPEDLTAAQVRTIINVADGANNYTHPNHSGDVTSSGDGATVIAGNAVTNTKMADMAQATIKGRASGAGTGDPTDLTAAQVRTIINVADGANNYTHPNHSGDVTSVADGATTIAGNAVTNTKLADMAANTIKGNNTGSAADPKDLTIAEVLSLLGAITASSTDTLTNKTLTAPKITGSSAPTGAEGVIYFNSTSKKYYGHNGTAWVEL